MSLGRKILIRRPVPPLWILRHGETEWNVEGRLQGHLDSALTSKGIAQAEAQNRILSKALPNEFEVLSSPSGRAWRTAEIALKGLWPTITPDPNLREIDMGDWQGWLIADAKKMSPQAQPNDPHLWKFTAPHGERLDQMTRRVCQVLNKLQGPTVLVTHGLTSRLLRCVVLELPAEDLIRVPGGQGVVHHIADGTAQILSE